MRTSIFLAGSVGRKMHKPLLNFTRTCCYSHSTSTQWRNQIKQNQLVSQISTILLQRHNNFSLLQNLNLSSKLTPPLFLQILYRTQVNPQISLNFFNWVIVNFQVQPDLKSQCHIIQLCVHAGLANSVKPILNSLLQTYSVSVIGSTMIHACKGKGKGSNYVLNFVLEGYSSKGSFKEALEMFLKMREFGLTASVSANHSLLDVLLRENQIKLAWCAFGAMIRDGFWLDKLTWSLIAKTLCKDEKFDRIVKMLDMGIYNSVMYNIVVDYCSKIGDFGAAFGRINEMCRRKLKPGFSTYSSILDGACKLRNDEIMDQTIAIMVEKDLLKNSSLSDSDSIIQKLCGSGKLNAALMFFKRACNEKIKLQDWTYEHLLKALSNDGKLVEAIDLYRLIRIRRIKMKDSTCGTFLDLICEQDESEEGYETLKELMEQGIRPRTPCLSKFTASKCHKQRWNEVEELLSMVLDKGFLPNSSSFCSLVHHYCRTRQINKALELHNKMEKLHATLDSTTYNILIDALVKEGRVEETVKLFDYVKQFNLATSESFSTVIKALCRAKELRKAMKLHDQMLELGLKPDKPIYKSLILEFQYVKEMPETMSFDF